MKFMKRSLTLMLAGLMAVSMVACGDKDTDKDTSKDADTSTTSTADDGRELVGNTYKTGIPIVKDKETFQVLLSGTPNDISKDQNDKEINKILNEDTNIAIDWVNVSSGFDEQLSLLLATQQTMPDMVLGAPTTATIDKNLKNMVDLTDMVEEWAPRIYEQTEANLEGGIENYKRADGKIYTLPTGVYAERANAVCTVELLNTKWIDNVGMELPTTTDEFRAVLQAFKDKDANGNGDPNDEIPSLFCSANWAGHIMSYAGPWGIAGNSSNDYNSYYWIKDGKFVPSVDTQAMRDFLTYMHDLCKDELINADGFTMESASYVTLTTGGTVGMYGGWFNNPEEWAVLPVITAPGYEGQETKQGQIGYRTANMSGFFITRACENPEAALRWWDEWHRDVYTKRVSRDGLPGAEGVWIENDDGSATVTTPAQWPTGIENQSTYISTVAYRGTGAVMFSNEVATPLAGSGTSDAVRYEYVDYYEDYLLTDFLPLDPVDEEQTKIKNDLSLELTEYLETFIANAIVSGTGLDDAGWQEHVDTLYNDLDMQEWIDWNQKYYDGEFKA